MTMKKLIFPILLLVLFVAPCVAHSQAIPCGNNPILQTPAAGEQQIAAPPAGHSIEVCYVIITATNGATPGNFSVDYGTGTNCGTGTTTLIPFAAGTASSPVSAVVGSPTTVVWIIPAGKNLCINFVDAPSVEQVTVLYAIL
jgi:hypothetical protein